MDFSISISNQAEEDFADIYSFFYPNEPWYSRGLRYFSINDYSIFYIIKDVEDRKEARVTHVTNGKRDLDRFLSDMKID